MYQKLVIVGRLGRDPEMRFTPAGKAVTNFTMATSETWKDDSGERQERTEWHRIVIWGKLAEVASKYLTKGSQVYIEGRLQTREWEKDGQKHYTTEIVASSLTMLGGGADPAGNGAKTERKSSGDEDFYDGAGSGGFEDIPFTKLNEWGC